MINLNGVTSPSPTHNPEADRDAKISYFLNNYRGRQLTDQLSKLFPKSYFVDDHKFGLICAIHAQDINVYRSMASTALPGDLSFRISRQLQYRSSFLACFWNSGFALLKTRTDDDFPFHLMPDQVLVASVLGA